MKMKATKDEKDHQSISLIKVIRSNWLPLLLAVCICLLTIIVVPILYSIKKSTHQTNATHLQWNISGTTILDNTNQAFGIISSIQFDRYEDLFFLDRSNHQLNKYNMISKRMSLVYGYANGSSANDSYSMNSPNDFIFDDDNRIYIVDTSNNRILLLPDEETQQSTTICHLVESESNRLQSPMSITWDLNWNVYIADYGNNRISICNLETNQLRVFKGNDRSGDRNTYVLTPISIRYAYDEEDERESLVIAQQTGFNVVRWELNSTSWTYVAGSVGSNLKGTSRTLFNSLCSIDINEYGNVFVVDCNNQRIQFYECDQEKGRTIAGVIEANGTNPYLFNYPTSITFDQDENLYVADSQNFRIQRFQRL